jgi:hypothetical protein
MVDFEEVPSMTTGPLSLMQHNQREMRLPSSASVDWHQGVVALEYDWMIQDVEIDQ